MRREAEIALTCPARAACDPLQHRLQRLIRPVQLRHPALGRKLKIALDREGNVYVPIL